MKELKDTLLELKSYENTNDIKTILEIDKRYKQLIQSFPKEIQLLVEYNEFRLKNQTILPHDRPKVIIGAINNATFPNFHTISLLRIADVVSLTTIDGDPRISRIYFNPVYEDFDSILKKLPEGFVPDLFWDSQVESSLHIIPRGIETAPCITACNFTHMLNINAIAHLSNVFDVLLPLSNVFIPLIKNISPNNKTILDIPFGLGWAAFDDIITPLPWEKKDIDVLVTFGPISNFAYGDYRARIVEIIQKFKEKYGNRYKIELTQGLSKFDYLSIQNRSKIGIASPPIWGPYNYRTCEVMSCKSLLFQVDTSNYPIPSKLTDYFENEKHFVLFTPETLEEKLLFYLEHQEEAKKIAEDGYNFLTRQYSYQTLYKKLFDEISNIKLSKDSRKLSRRLTDFHLGMTYSYWEEKDNIFNSYFSLLPLNYIFTVKEPIASINLLYLLPELYQNQFQNQIFHILSQRRDILNSYKKGLKNSMKYIYKKSKKNLLAKWNYISWLMANKEATVNQVEQLINTIDKKSFKFDLLYTNIRWPKIESDDYRDKRLKFNCELLLNYNDKHKMTNIIKDYMKWHCKNYIKNM